MEILETLEILFVAAGVMLAIAIIVMAFSVAVDRLAERFRNWRCSRRKTNNK